MSEGARKETENAPAAHEHAFIAHRRMLICPTPPAASQTALIARDEVNRFARTSAAAMALTPAAATAPERSVFAVLHVGWSGSVRGAPKVAVRRDGGGFPHLRPFTPGAKRRAPKRVHISLSCLKQVEGDDDLAFFAFEGADDCSPRAAAAVHLASAHRNEKYRRYFGSYRLNIYNIQIVFHCVIAIRAPRAGPHSPFPISARAGGETTHFIHFQRNTRNGCRAAGRCRVQVGR